MNTTRIALSGATGRMGRAIIRELAARPDAELAAALARPSSDGYGRDAGELSGLPALGIAITDDPGDTAFDVMIDFSLPEATLAALNGCRQAGRPLVIGTTGLTGEHHRQIDAAASEIAVLVAANTSVGINLCLKLLETAAATLGDEYDVEVIEAHHRNKVDAPSGTALALGETLARTLGRDLATDGVFGRHGHTGARPERAIGFSVIRAGDIVGEHTVLFANAAERIEITHRAASRATFASGAVRAALWLAGQRPGRYDMSDALNLR